MRQIGHLKDWCSQTSSVQLGIPTRVATPLAANSLRLLWIFQNLQHLNITFNSTRSRIEQPIVVACAELLVGPGRGHQGTRHSGHGDRGHQGTGAPSQVCNGMMEFRSRGLQVDH